MLVGLTIHDIVLIDRLHLDLGAGLNVLTGETGAGKSILLDALGLALGGRARGDMLRAGAAEGGVTAEFHIAGDHPAHALLRDADLPGAEDGLLLRRAVDQGGRTRGFVNDRRVSVETLRALGATLVEVHGQHDDRGLLNPAGHRALLDAFAGVDARAVREAWAAWRAAQAEADEARATMEAAARDAEYLRHAVAELEAMDPQPDEDAALDAERRRRQAAARLREDVAAALAETGAQGAEGALLSALRRLSRATDSAEGALDDALAALERAASEAGEAAATLERAAETLADDPLALERAEERLFALRALARKHDVAPDALPELAARMTAELAQIDGGAAQAAALDAAVTEKRAAYDAAASKASQVRRAAAARLDAAMAAELPPLKMERAVFTTTVTPEAPGPDGADRVAFTVATNPGAPAGPIDRIASGGELSRFLLALKVCLAGKSQDATLIFDEIDRGVGGATADAVGRRLARLAEGAQVLVVTHSPQVAARGARHWRIQKALCDGAMRTEVVEVAARDRAEELARMLAGETVTDAARAAAQALLAT